MPRSSGRGFTAQAARTFAPFVRPYWRGFLPSLASVVAISFVGLLRPWPLKFLVDDVLKVGQEGERPDVSAGLVAAIAGSIVAIAVLHGLLSYLKEFFLSATAQRVAFGLRRSLFAHIQRLSLAFHDQKRTGDLLTRITNDVGKVQELVTDDLLVGGGTSIIQLAGVLVVMFVVDWQLGLVAALSAPLIVFIGAHYRSRIRADERRVREKEGDIASLAQETISSIRVVKAFGREEFESGRFEEQTSEMLDASLRVTRLEARFSWALNVATAASLAALIAVGVYRVAAGSLSAGVLVVFVQYLRDLQSPLTTLSKLATKMAKTMVRAERIMEVLNERPAIEQRPGARPAPPLRGLLELANVSFAYGAGPPVLRDVSLRAAPGELVAVVGPTGAGKSTLASLVLRLYDPDRGAVKVDGHDLRDLELNSFVDQVSVVLQESLLFQASIAENIAYGRPDASPEQIRRAATVAYCDEFIERLPRGFDTVVGERGTTLSGGQRQRIAIARAVVRDAPILLLDEPTTGLDAEAETSVLRALEALMQGRTTLLIAHKVPAVRRAHRIYVLDDGRVVEEGTGEELEARGGLFARLYASGD